MKLDYSSSALARKFVITKNFKHSASARKSEKLENYKSLVLLDSRPRSCKFIVLGAIVCSSVITWKFDEAHRRNSPEIHKTVNNEHLHNSSFINLSVLSWWSLTIAIVYVMIKSPRDTSYGTTYELAWDVMHID